MKSVSCAAFTAGVLLLAGTAQAADLVSPRMLAAPVLEDDYSSGWYVRGDVLANFGIVPSSGFRPNGAAAQPFGNSRFDAAWGAALGAGLKYKWLRSDITVDYRLPTHANANSFVGNVPGAAFASNERMRIDTATAMWNVYADLGTWSLVTPYIGAGIGVSRIGMNEAVSTNLATGVVTNRGDNLGSGWSFAYAAMAGVSVAVSPRMAVDLGYRFVNFGQASFTGATGTLDTGNLYGHEVRFGLRYMIF